MRIRSAGIISVIILAFAIFQTGIPNAYVKPTGTPTINTGNSLTTGLVYYTFDTGSGYALLQDSSPGHAMYPPTQYGANPLVGGPSASNCTGAPSITTTSYGTGYNWPGASAESGTLVCESSWVFDPTDTLRSIVNLYNQSGGSGVTIGAWLVPTAYNTAFSNIVFGRGAAGFLEMSPYATLLLSMDANGLPQFWFYTTGATNATVIAGSTPLSLNAFHTMFGTCINDSTGSATCKLTVDGTEVATSSGNAVHDTTPGQEQDEGQVQFGSYWHVYANHVSNVGAGAYYAGGLWNRGLSLSERQSLSTQPWQIFN